MHSGKGHNTEMYSFRRPLTCTAAALVLLAGACSSPAATPSASVAPSVSASTASSLVVAPYLDVTGTAYDVDAFTAATGIENFTLAFVLSSGTGSCTPSWGGIKSLSDATVTAEIDKVHAAGGQTIIATGGANGTYLESVCTSSELAAAYGKVLDATGSTALDIDIEKTVDADAVAKALASVQQERGTSITVTLPVGEGEAGLTSAAQSFLRSVESAGVDVTVNAMTMDFSASGDWGTAMTLAAEAVHDDLASIWTDKDDASLYAMLGVTPMIGANDTGALTTISDARTLLGWASRQGLGFARFWSVNRDRDGCEDGEVSASCSGVSQDEYAFGKLFATFG